MIPIQNRRVFALLCQILLLATPALAQENLTPEQRLAAQALQPRLGIFGDVAFNMHTGNFGGAPGVPTCLPMDSANFTGGNGLGFAAGLLFELPLDPSLFLMMRAGYYSMGVEQTVQADIGPIVVGNEAVPGIS